MQVQKDNIRRRILVAAKREFFSKGVKHTSIKQIASAANVAVGNIYNYFDSKNELLAEVCSPLLKALEEYLHREMEQYYQTLEVFSLQCYQDAMISRFLELVEKYRPEFRLLLFETAGTSLENYFEHYGERQAEMGIKYIAEMKKKYPHINTNISPYLIQITCALWFQVLRTVIRNGHMSHADLQHFVSDYILFGIGGWEKLLTKK